MPRYAAIDIGSNSTRLAVAEVPEGGGPTTLLASDREVTRLGTSVFTEGEISKAAMDLLVQTLGRFAITYRKFGVTGVRAVATSAVRDARNQEQFLRRASSAIGAPVEIISGLEESRLIHAGVQAVWPHPDERILIIDIGGGSAEVIVAENGKLENAYSRPLGAVRLKELFLQSDPAKKVDLTRMNAFIDEKIAAMVKKTGLCPFDRAIATSATAAAVISAVNQVPRRARENADRMSATTDEIGGLAQKLARRNLAARRKVTGIGPRRAEIIVPGVSVLHRILTAYQCPEVSYSIAGVRDGIIADLAARGAGSQHTHLAKEQRQAVEAMARRFGVDVRHARKTAQLASTLFAGLQPLHQLPPSAGRLLEAAAYLIDTGHFVSDMGHHKHSYYLVANSDLPAFTTEERQAIALLCRFHRKSMPQARHEAYEELPADRKRLVLRLIPILRLADGLDRSHDQRVDGVEVSVAPSTVEVTLRSGADPQLEVWAGEQVAAVFKRVYRKELSIRRAP